jgi:DNA polymerase-1
MKNKKFMIVDGSSLVHRSFYALPLLTNREGVFTNAAYGFTNMFLKILDKEQPDCVVVFFDKSRITFRNKQYEKYKSNRKKTPSELKPQFSLVKKIVRALGIVCYDLEGYEADDLIGTIAKQSEENGANNIIITGDKDALQLVSQSTEVLLTRKGISEMEKYSIKEVKDKYGLTPEQMIELKGLMGDQSDNIPGVAGVGEKTALKLLHEYSTIENLYDNLDNIKGKLKEKLQNNKDMAFLSKKLATIDTNAPLEFDVKECNWQGADYEQLLKIFKDLEFTSLIKRILEEMKENVEDDRETNILEKDKNIEKVKSKKELNEMFKELSEDSFLSIYIDCNYEKNEINAVGISNKQKKWSIDVKKIDDFILVFRDEVKKYNLILHDSKKVYKIFKNNGVLINNIVGDTMLAGYLLNPSASSYFLPELCLEYLGKSLVEDENIFEDAAIKADINMQLNEKLTSELEAMDMAELYFELELPLIKILGDMELSGIRVNRDELNKMNDELQERIKNLKNKIYEIADEKFNINSPKQLSKILFEKMDLPVIKKTKTGYSTSAEVLEELSHEYPIAEELLNYRYLTKLKSTYVEGLKKLLTAEDKIHTTFNQTITATGRLSSTEPNLQNIPIRMDLGRKLRKFFIPDNKDEYILAADYSQIELRVLAHISDDENLIDAFNKGQDIHTRTAAEVFHVDMDKVTQEMRRNAKAVNFGIVYGISDFGLSRDLGISRKDAKRYIEKYFERYPKVALYMENIAKDARDKGYVSTVLNRRRYLPNLFSPNQIIRNAAERTAMNTPIQGSAADIIKLAMLKIADMTEKNKSAVMLLQVHDELIFRVKKDKLDEIAEMVIGIMENAYKISVPLKVDVKYGDNWYDLKKYN